MLNVENAVKVVLDVTQAGSVEQISLSEALFRVLGRSVAAPHDSPPFDKALMDGFALNSEQFRASAAVCDTPSVRLPVLETLTAGMVSTIDLRTAVTGSEMTGTVRVMTGAAVPAGTDCVVPIEQTQFSDQAPDSVGISPGSVAAGFSVMRRGESAKAGENLMNAGVRLNAQHLAALAEFGIADVLVHEIPRCAVLATGDELVPFTESPAPGQIRNSNEPMLLGQVRQNHGEPVGLGIAADDRQILRTRIQQGLECDFLLLTGGVSAGILDLVPAVLADCGVRKIFHGVRMKPGKPLWFGLYEQGGHRCCVFGLPGNPVSSMACFELFVKPALRKFSGLVVTESHPMRARLADTFRIKGDRPIYHPARIYWGPTGLEAQTVKWNGSADLRATVDANGMILFEPQSEPINAGSLLPVWLWMDNG